MREPRGLAPRLCAALALLAWSSLVAAAGDLGRADASLLDKLGALRNGDFDRPAPSIFDGLLPRQLTLGPVTRIPGYPLTDAEEELRNRSYDLIRLPQRREEWKLILASLAVAKVLPPSILAFDRTAYGNMLIGLAFRSEAGRYSRLIDDVSSDMMLVGPFLSVACWVIDMDAKRARSLDHVAGLTRGEFADARARINENRMVIAWVEHSLVERAWSYRYAVERLVIAAPSPLAADAERAVDRLRAQIAGVAPFLAQCAAAASVVQQPNLPSRRLITK